MPRPPYERRLRDHTQENPMSVIHYIGFDVHKKSVSYCVKDAAEKIIEEGKLRATCQVLRQWAGIAPSRGTGRWKPHCSAAGSTTR
jgi:hypothetical protein